MKYGFVVFTMIGKAIWLEFVVDGKVSNRKTKLLQQPNSFTDIVEESFKGKAQVAMKEVNNCYGVRLDFELEAREA